MLLLKISRLPLLLTFNWRRQAVQLKHKCKRILQLMRIVQMSNGNSKWNSVQCTLEYPKMKSNVKRPYVPIALNHNSSDVRVAPIARAQAEGCLIRYQTHLLRLQQNGKAVGQPSSQDLAYTKTWWTYKSKTPKSTMKSSNRKRE